MWKKWLFSFANYSNPTKYEAQYQSEQCAFENLAIRQVLNQLEIEGMAITDIGCGTGLGRAVMPQVNYMGIDRSEEAIKHCENQHKGEFMVANAEHYIHTVERLNPVFIFSINYLNLSTIRSYLEKTEHLFVAIRYNEPYLSKTSVYSGRKFFYKLFHSERRERLLDALFEEFGARSFPLLSEPYYTVTIVDKRNAERG